MDWTADIDGVLNNIRINSLLLSNKHKARYFELRDSLKWYRLPVIVLNGANSIISVGMQPYATQGAISITTSLIRPLPMSRPTVVRFRPNSAIGARLLGGYARSR